MKPINNFTSRKATTRETLPAGAYVAKIMDVTAESTSEGREYLLIRFDITEGEGAGIFRRDYVSQDPMYGTPKWRGVYRLWIPTGDGSERDGWTKRSFENAVACLEESNSGYHWNWNEKLLKGKLIGVNYRNREWSMDGRSGWTTECGALCSAVDVRGGKVRMLKDKPLPSAPAVNAGFTMIDDDEIPF